MEIVHIIVVVTLVDRLVIIIISYFSYFFFTRWYYTIIFYWNYVVVHLRSASFNGPHTPLIFFSAVHITRLDQIMFITQILNKNLFPFAGPSWTTLKMIFFDRCKKSLTRLCHPPIHPPIHRSTHPSSPYIHPTIHHKTFLHHSANTQNFQFLYYFKLN